MLPQRIVIVGAGAGGLGVAEGLRARSHTGSIVMIGDEEIAPYDRPPLSKQVLSDTWTTDQVFLRSRSQLEELRIDFRLGVAATGIDVEHRKVLTDRGDVDYDTLVVATGVRPRILPFAVGIDGLHTVRTVNDVMRLKAVLSPGKKVIVVGAGVLGSEIASVLVTLGHEVLIVSNTELPLERQFDPSIGETIVRLHQDAGAEYLGSVNLVGFTTDSSGPTGIMLDDGRSFDADVIIVAVGSVPNVEWLRGSGIDLSDGVLCDATGRAAENIYAVGDVARWRNKSTGEHSRVEHRTNASEQAEVVASNIVGEFCELDSVPYFWSDQYDVRIQAYGRTVGFDEAVVVSGSLEDDRYVLSYLIGDEVVGVLGWNSPRDIHRQRTAIGKPRPSTTR